MPSTTTEISRHRAADEAELPRRERRRALANDVQPLAEVLFLPRVVVVVVHREGRLRAEDAEHFRDHEVPPRVGILACQPHRLEVRLAERGRRRE